MADFGLLNPLPNFTQLATNAFLIGQKQGQERSTRNALAQYATDPEAGKNALLQGGDLNTYGQVQGLEQRQQQAQRQDQQFQDQQAAAEAQAQQQKKDWVTKAAVGLRGLPAEARTQAFVANVAPTLKSDFGISDEQIQQTAANGISDQALDGFIAQLGGPGRTYQEINTGNGGISTFEPATGHVNQVQAPTVKGPTAPAGYAYVKPPAISLPSQGVVTPGNIDLNARPIHQNADGSISTVRSISIGTQDGEVLIPTIADDGTPLSNDQAVALYNKTGRHLGIFDNEADATAYAKALHEQQAAQYGTPRLAPIPGGPADPHQAGSLAASRRVGGGRSAPSSGGLSQPGTNAAPAVGGPLTVDAIDQAARQYAITGKLPALGMKSSGEKTAIMNRAAVLQGADPTIPATAAKYKADSQALNAQAKTRQAMETAEQTALSNMDLAIEEAKRGSAAPNIPFVSGSLQKARVDGLHNAGATKLRNYVQAAANEAAKVLAGGTGGQGATDAARREAEARFNEGMPLHQLIAARDAMRAEMASRVSAASKTESDLHDRLASYIKGSGPAAAAQRLTPQQAQALPPGTKFIGQDGVERTRH